MSTEKYLVEIGEQGSEGLGKLDYCFNKTTQEFLVLAGLKPGMRVLDIGCGSGVITCWIAKQVGEGGEVVAIENDINQLNAAQRTARNENINNIKFKLCSAYEIETLEEQFDFIYCRFVLHHLHNPSEIIHKIYKILKPGGIYASEEGIVNFSFSYPFSAAWGDEAIRVPPVWIDSPAGQRDGNIGIKMISKMKAVGFNIHFTKIIHPLLITKEEKKLLLLGMHETKSYYLEQGHSENEWDALVTETKKIIDNDLQIAGFYASCQVAGCKQL